MMGQGRTACDNLNHRRDRVSIRHCAACGDVVNDRVGARRCTESEHATARRQRTIFCVDCGTRLIADR